RVQARSVTLEKKAAVIGIRPGLRSQLDDRATEAAELGIVVVGCNFQVVHRVFLRNDHRRPGPTRAGSGNTVDHIFACVVLSAVALYLWRELAFCENALAGLDAAVLLGGQVVLVAVGGLRIVA